MHRVDSVRGLPINPRARAVLRQQTDRLSALPAPVTRAPTLTGHFKVGGGGGQECQVHHQEMMRELMEEEAHSCPLYTQYVSTLLRKALSFFDENLL